jgi:septal ring factor EnvC (AmiA/AmiB activator)
MYRHITIALLSILLAGCATSPDLTNDPRGGGFFGGIVGLTRGDYTARKQERADALSSIKRVNQGVSQDNRALEQTRLSKQDEIRQLKQRVTKLNSDVRSLSAQIASLRQRSASGETSQLQRRVGALDRKVAALKRRTGGGDPAALARETAQAEKEAEVLMQISMALSDTGGTATSPSARLRDVPH